MSSRLDHSATLRIGGKLDASFRAAIGGISGATNRVQANLATLKNSQRDVARSLREAESAAKAFGVEGSQAVSRLTEKQKALRGMQRAVAAELSKAERAAVRLGKDGSDEVNRLRRESARLERQERDVTNELRDARREAERLGIEGSSDVARFRREHERLGRTIEHEQRRLGRLRTVTSFGDKAIGTLRSVGTGLMTVAGAALRAGAVVSGLGLGALGLFTRSAIKAMAGIEKIQTALETLEGSQGRAQSSMDWIIRFADETPFELEQVAEAFTRLRAYGIDPTDGTLRTLGDTAASMGKDVMQAVEAMADAVTGETERLKEFGIRSATEGKRLTFFYKDALGKDVQKAVNKTSQAAIRTTLAAVWNDKYAGSMQKASRTWDGLMSTLRSKWTLFQVRVMRSGVFDTLKGQLVGMLDSINRWAEDGTLDRWAKRIASAYQDAFRAVSAGFSWVRDNWPEIKAMLGELWSSTKTVAGALFTVGKALANVSSWTASLLGGWKNLMSVMTSVGPLATVRQSMQAGFKMLEWIADAGEKVSALSRSLKGDGLVQMPSTPSKAAIPSPPSQTGESRVVQKAVPTVTGDALLEKARSARKPMQADAGTRTKSSTTTIHHSPVIHIRVDAAKANADEVAEKVSRRLQDEMRREALAAHG